MTRLWNNPSHVVNRADVEAALDFSYASGDITTVAVPSPPAERREKGPWYWGTDFPEGNFNAKLREFKKRARMEALRRAGGNEKEAARLLGIHRRTFDGIKEQA